MKKTYINPEMTIVKVRVANQILAGSIGKGEGNIDPNDVGAPEFDFEL